MSSYLVVMTILNNPETNFSPRECLPTAYEDNLDYDFSVRLSLYAYNDILELVFTVRLSSSLL